MEPDHRISLGRRCAAAFVVLALILVSFASVSTRFHSHHPVHAHPHTCQHHPQSQDGDADHGLPNACNDSTGVSCGLCLFLAGCPAPETIILKDIGFPEAIAWIGSLQNRRVHPAEALRPQERGPPKQA